MPKQKVVFAPVISRIKAFIIDLFLISIPLLYFTTYVVLGGKSEFQGDQLAIFIVWLCFGLIQSTFFAKSAASPGYKSQGIYAVNSDGKKAGFFVYFLRYILFVVGFLFGGSFLCFFRKDRRNLHDLLLNIVVVAKK